MDASELALSLQNRTDTEDLSAVSLLGIGWNMDDEEFSAPGTPVEASGVTPDANSDQPAVERQSAQLQTYLDSVPYECESIEEMDMKLAGIIDKMYICAKSNHWTELQGWDDVFNYWLQLRYPLSKASRVKILHYYYEFSIVPGIEPSLIRGHVNMFSNLLPRKSSSARMLDISEFELDWKPLWRVLKKELWPMKRLHDPTRNVANLLLYLAERGKRYYPAREIPDMLNTFLPLLTKETVLTMVPVLTSFLPPYKVHEYLPALFAIWEAFNSSVVDDRLIELMGELAEDHVAGPAGPSGEEGGAPWRDVGIWTQDQWTLMMSKCLGSMNVPVGAAKGASTTSGHADALGKRHAQRVKKNTNRHHSLAKLIVYSMSIDGPVKAEATQGTKLFSTVENETQAGFLAGCKALDSLEKMITSTESFFHPSNTGPWTFLLSSFLQRLASEFCKRWKEEEDSNCKTPEKQRLTPAIRRAFVLTLRTPMLLALFAKDPISMGLAQGALRSMALLQPDLVMPQLLERAYGGLEVVNETHRTTAVLSMLSGVALPLVSEKIWVGGQKHLVPLLELCIPGIDLNDPAKTICATMFICAAVQHIKIGDLSIHAQSAGVLTSDDAPPGGAIMDVVMEDAHLPDGSTDAFPLFDKAEERALVRDSTAGFADWVTSLFRRVFALYENLPEEGGRKNTTGGKQEENVLKTIKNTLDVVCLHLSDQLFDLVLKIVYDYTTTNTKSNAVRAIGQLISCLARVKPQETLDKFLPFCANQILEELKHGASSVRTTTTHAAVPSDTTLHWNMSILRGCLGYSGSAVLKHKAAVLELVIALIDKAKSERGYSGAGRLLTRLLHTLSGVYPVNSRFVNADEWKTEEFVKNHNLFWGKMYEAKDVKIEWHVPSDDEISFVLEIIEQVAAPLLKRLEQLLGDTSTWDNIARNDFCRYLYAVRSVWAGLPTIVQEENKNLSDPAAMEGDATIFELYPARFDVNAGFTLTDTQDSRYHFVVKQREYYGRVVHDAAVALRGHTGGEDHIDAIIGVSKAIEVYFLEYGITRTSFASLQRNYALARDLNKLWPRQRENSRLVFLKRAQVWHNARMCINSMYRRRSKSDVLLFDDLVEFSLSPYTRVRRHSQNILYSASGHYPMSKRYIFRTMILALAKGSDPDRMKGALYVLSNKTMIGLVRSNRELLQKYVIALLECQHEEKPSLQKLVASVLHELLQFGFNEESLRTLPPFEENRQLDSALKSLRSHYPVEQLDFGSLERAIEATSARSTKDQESYDELISGIIEIARKPSTHWRYLQMAIRCLVLLLRRDRAPNEDVAKLLVETTTKSHPSTRTIAQRGVVKLLAFCKIRSFSHCEADMWYEEWTSPLRRDLPVSDAGEVLTTLQRTFSTNSTPKPSFYIDKITSGFLAWEKSLKAYSVRDDSIDIQSFWEPLSKPALEATGSTLAEEDYFSTLFSLWAQESDARGNMSADLELRKDNVIFMKSIAKMFEAQFLDKILAVADPLLSDQDRFKQRAAAEIVYGVLRGSKHWSESSRKLLWNWFMSRLPTVYNQIKPDTVGFWESVFLDLFTDWDPQRNKPLIDWVLALPLEFNSDSAFTMTKSLGVFACLVDVMGIRFSAASNRYIDMFLDNTDTGYAEIRAHIAQILTFLLSCQWNLSYPSVDAFLAACKEGNDPLNIRKPKHIRRIEEFAQKLPEWRLDRLPPPRTNQSQFDKVSLSLLTWIWSSGHGPQASMIFPYVLPILPEILKMTDLNDNPEMQLYSSAALYVLSAVTPPKDYVELVVNCLISTLRTTTSWKIKLNGLPILIVFFYRNLISFSDSSVASLMDVLITCLSDENVEVRETAAKLLSGLLRCSQRGRILPLRNRFVSAVRSIKLPERRSPGYAEALRALHSAILGVCALIESFPYSVEPWMPPLTEVLAPHSSDPPPISTTIRKCASEFKKTHQDTWHSDQQAFDEEQLQALSNMLIGTSYYA